MPRAFNDREEAHIRASLREHSQRLFASQGVMKTSIEQITKAAGIAKGSFYKFYDSKELLFFELLEETQNNIRAPLAAGPNSSTQKTRRYFERLMHKLFNQICAEPLIQHMGRESEFMAISRKAPPEILKTHQQDDQKFLDRLIEQWNTRSRRPQRDVVAARMSLILLVSLKHGVFSEKQIHHAATAAISSLADCFFSRTD